MREIQVLRDDADVHDEQQPGHGHAPDVGPVRAGDRGLGLSFSSQKASKEKPWILLARNSKNPNLKLRGPKNPKTLKPKNPKTQNPKTLKPKTLNPKT